MRISALVGISVLALSPVFAQDPAPAPEPTRIVVECEDMKGVDQDHFGPGKKWQVGRWGYDLYQNMVFGGVWASRLRNAMTDEGDNAAEAVQEIDVPVDGTYMVWAKYECPPSFNYAFGIRIEPARGKPVFDQTYGLRKSAKVYCFNDKPITGDLYWNWGIDHDTAEGYQATLKKGRYRLVLYKKTNPKPAGARSVDVIMLTTDLSPVSAPRMNRYPLLDELRRANHVYFRFHNKGSAPVRIQWNHWNHRYPDFYTPFYRDLVKFYDDKGQPLEGGKNGDWLEPIAPGQASPWYDLGPTMNTESTSPFTIQALPAGAKPTDPSAPFAVDIALEPDARQIVKSFTLDKGEHTMGLLVQPDLFRPDGVRYTVKTVDLYREITRELNRTPRLGPIPQKLRLYAGTGSPVYPMPPEQLGVTMEFREALGLNTLLGADAKGAAAILAWGLPRQAVIDRSLYYHHSTDIPAMIKWVKDGGVEKQFYYLSYGDEIGLPAVDVKDDAKVAAFRDYLRQQGETPASLGLASWDQVKPLASMSPAVAVQIGVLPADQQDKPGALGGLKKLYWYSLKFQHAQGIQSFAAKTKELRAALGPEVHTSANLGGMHPFYWMHQSSFIESFKHHAMSLAWSEDYTYCMPEASRLVADFEAAYLRKGASYHDNPTMFYCMPHWPGNTAEQLIQNAVLEWGQNIKELDFFGACPDVWSTENYIAYRGGMPTWKAIRTISGMAGLIEDHLLPARTAPARIAMLLSESSDVWETEGLGQGAVAPGSVPTNVSQEERKNTWYALRQAGYQVDHVTEDDCAEGLLQNYQVLYVCGQNLDRQAARAIKDWVKAGGTLYATAGAARKDQFDVALTDLDEVLGRGKQIKYQRYRGPLRARIELIWQKPLDQLKLAGGETVKALCSREEFAVAKGATVLGTYQNGKPAWIENAYGKGRAFYTGALPAQAYIQAALPVTPVGKGGSQQSPWMTEYLGFDPAAASVILHAAETAGVKPESVASVPGIVCNRLKSPKSTVVTVVNLGQQANGDARNVQLDFTGVGRVKRAWSCFHSKGKLPLKQEKDKVTVTLPTLAAADVIVLEH
ncbi:beta-galactosidase trimerization domain-containing protein [bacterium]|nr:beta-galactosidase trimerization domain-containing protein [bacterium]